MRSSGKSQFVRALPVLLLAAALFALPSFIKGKSRGGADITQLDLLPNIRKGLDLTFYTASENTAELTAETSVPSATHAPVTTVNAASLGVWDGEKETTMSLEDYIIGVTAAEMPASYEIEALKAQAVAARTFTLKHMTGELRCKSGHTICTDYACCQAFVTVEQMRRNWGERFDRNYARIREAVLGTEGMVLTSGGQLVTALYHSSSGGRTEDCEAVFAVALPYLVSVESGGEESSPEYMAEKVYTREEFIRIINEKFPDAMMTDPKKDVEVWQRTDSGRIALIRLGGTVRTGQQLRTALNLHSTNVTFDIDENTVRLTCLGFGHGVGMSQCGANAMAKQGADYEAILKHYYTGVELTSMENGG